MKDGSTYPTNQAIAVLVAGEPGSGKTNLCLDWPDPYVIDCEGNMKNAIERHAGKRFWYDNPERDDKDALLPEDQRWTRIEQLLNANAAKPEVKTIVVDGLGAVTDYLKAFLVTKGGDAEKPLVVGGQRVMTKSLWGPFADLLKRFVFKGRSYGKPFVLTSHLKVDENEMTAVKEQRVNLQGQLVSDFPKLFTDFWMTVATPVPVSKEYPTGVKYSVKTVPTIRITLKCSCGLPPEFETRGPEWQALMQRIGGASS